MENAAEGREPRLCVLKFGSSVIRRNEDYAGVAVEVYRHVRAGEKVVAVVSAPAGQTDALLDEAQEVGGPAAPEGLVARLARIGELRSAALTALALSRAGLRACAMDPDEMGLVAEGAPLDSNLCGLDAAAVRARLVDHDVVVVPGFTAGHAEHGVVTLGRGGTDLSAVFFAARLNAHRVRLIKDVDGVYAEDPARDPAAERFSQMDYAAAAQASCGLIQAKAICAAEEEEVLIEVAALGSGEATTIAHLPVVKGPPPRGERLKVALLGCGAVGAGVLAYLQSRPDLFEVGPVLVRRPELHREQALFTDRPQEALAARPDVLIELIGGADFPADMMRSALRHGAQVVTANKAALARHWDSLHACAEIGGGALRYSAAVGGGAPVLEAIARLAGSVAAVEGVMNGTCNFLLSRLAEGWSFDEAVAKAQELGFAEADPSADVDGGDAADKLAILVRDAFGIALHPDRIARDSLREVSAGQVRAALDRGDLLKQVGRCRLLADGSIEASVRVVALPAAHPLAAPRNEENCFLVTDLAGRVHRIFGKGAGRWPTATSVFEDVMDAQRALLGRAGAADAPRAPLKLLA